MKKSILGLGSAAAIIAPIAGVVACSHDDDSKEKTKTVSEILTSKVLVLTDTEAALTNSALLDKIKMRFEMDYGLELKKAHMLTVTSQKDGAANGTTFAAISVTKDADAKMVYVKVMANDEEVAKDIEVKVRKETDTEKNQRIIDHFEKGFGNYQKTADALDLTLLVSNGINAKNAYTNAEALVSLKAKITAATWSDNDFDALVADSKVKFTIKKYGSTDAASTGDNTVDISAATKIMLSISSEFGAAEDKVEKEFSFYIKTGG